MSGKREGPTRASRSLLTAHRSPQYGGGSGLVVRPVFKTAMETPSAAPVGSIPTRSATWVLGAGLLVGTASRSPDPGLHQPSSRPAVQSPRHSTQPCSQAATCLLPLAPHPRLGPVEARPQADGGAVRDMERPHTGHGAQGRRRGEIPAPHLSRLLSAAHRQGQGAPGLAHPPGVQSHLFAGLGRS